MNEIAIRERLVEHGQTLFRSPKQMIRFTSEPKADALLTYKIVKAVGEETVKGNVAFDHLEQLVNEHIREGWQPVRGIAVSSVTGPKTTGSTKNNWYLPIAQALVRESVE